MKTTQDKIEAIRKHGYAFDFGTTFNHAFEIYKKIAATAGVAMLIFGFIITIFIMAYVFTSIDWQHLQQNPQDFTITNFSTTGLISYVVIMILFTAIAVPLSAGIMKMCYNAETGNEVSLANAFEYYSGHYFVDLFMAGLIIGGVNTVLSVGLEFVGSGWVASIIGVLIGVFTIIFAPLIVFGNLRPMEAIRASFIVTSKEFLMIFLMLIVGYIISICGIIACCVGIFFTIPVLYAIQYSIYVHSVGFEDYSENEQIG